MANLAALATGINSAIKGGVTGYSLASAGKERSAQTALEDRRVTLEEQKAQTAKTAPVDEALRRSVASGALLSFVRPDVEAAESALKANPNDAGLKKHAADLLAYWDSLYQGHQKDISDLHSQGMNRSTYLQSAMKSFGIDPSKLGFGQQPAPAPGTPAVNQPGVPGINQPGMPR